MARNTLPGIGVDAARALRAMLSPQFEVKRLWADAA
jgi:hypothetical protein